MGIRLFVRFSPVYAKILGSLGYYYNIDKAAEQGKTFDRQPMKIRHELESEKRISEHENQYRKYFEVQTTPVRGTKVIVKEEAVRQAKHYFGYLALITNKTMNAVTALQLYHNKDLVETAFGDHQERLNLRRTLVSSEQSHDGKLVVELVA